MGVAPFGMGGGAFSLAPAVGDSVRIDLYYNRTGGGVAATATDITTNKTQVVNIGEGTNAVFNNAEVACVLKNPAASPTADSRLWQFTDTAVTTYNGVRGTMTGPWTTSEVIDTTNGGADRANGDEPVVPVQQQRELRRLDPHLPAEVRMPGRQGRQAHPAHVRAAAATAARAFCVAGLRRDLLRRAAGRLRLRDHLPPRLSWEACRS